MNRKLKSSSRLFANKGLTLIEVIMATALMSTMLVATVSLFQKHRNQLLQASRKRDAVQEMDLLLAQWFSDELKWPSFPAQGRLREGSDFVWQASPSRQLNLGVDRTVEVINLKIVAESSPRTVLAEAEFLALLPKPLGQVQPNESK